MLLTAIAAGGLIACGSDDDENARQDNKREGVEKAFLTAMVAHHQSAIEMSEIAETRAEEEFIKQLAADISVTQEREITRMKQIYERRLGSELKPDHTAHEGLGLSAERAGMTHSAEMNEILRSADPFDRAFVDEMVPHHEGAVRMAKVVLKSTEDAALRKLAQGIISTQEREIQAMNDFRTKEFGGLVPSGHRMGSEEKMPDGEEDHGADHSG